VLADSPIRQWRGSNAQQRAEHLLSAYVNNPRSPGGDEVQHLVEDVLGYIAELEGRQDELETLRRRLEAYRDRYVDLYDFAPLGYLTLDEEGYVQEINLAGAGMLEEEREAVIGYPLSGYVTEEDLPVFLRHLRDCVHGRREVTAELCLVAKSERRITVQIRSIPLEEREVGLCKTAITDITERREMEEELRAAKESADRAQAAAEVANRAKDYFLAVLSHELRMPLTPVVMGVSMLQDRSDLDAGFRETLDMVRSNAEMEARLIDDLLDMSRITWGKVELHRERVALEEIIRRAVAACQPDIAAKSLALEFDTGTDAPYWVEVDAGRMQQVFWNLLKNATNFTPPGGRIRVRCRKDGSGSSAVIVEVSDSGIGIAREAMPWLFNSFARAEHSMAQRFGGLGLGLTISKTLVEMHGGTIEAHSDGAGKGASFRVCLPRGDAAIRPEPPTAALGYDAPARRLTILLVEDHGATAKVLRLLLAKDGHDVEVAPDVAGALEAAGQQRFDLLLCDMGLPDGNGYDLLGELRARGYNFPGIALTGYGQQEDIRRSREAGFIAHLTKPVPRDRLLGAIAAVAGSRQ
jgi:two-component system, chemotaxis family, CheB/CheR fusion protein